jgi:hypothetical protein
MYMVEGLICILMSYLEVAESIGKEKIGQNVHVIA